MIFPLYMHRESAAGVSGYCHGYITTLKQGNRIKYVFTVDCVISYLSGVLALNLGGTTELNFRPLWMEVFYF